MYETSSQANSKMVKSAGPMVRNLLKVGETSEVEVGER